MKRTIAWVIRGVCILLVIIAAVVWISCLIHMNETAEDAAKLKETETPTSESVAPSAVQATITVVADKTSMLATGTVSGLAESITGATVEWYVNDALIQSEADVAVADGQSFQLDLKTANLGVATEADVQMAVIANGNTIYGNTVLALAEAPAVTSGSAVDDVAPTQAVETENIPVTADTDAQIYDDAALATDSGNTFASGSEGAVLDYSNQSGDKAYQVRFDDASTGWVKAADVTVSTENCTTDKDYDDATKEDYVNNEGYTSKTEYLVWVSLYTQKVNVFTGSEGSWKLEKSYPCSTGKNETPTVAGEFTYSTKDDQWDLGDTYVKPVLVFNGGVGFTSQPYSTTTDTIADDTMGEPSSGGSVRMQEDDISWLADNLPLDSAIVVY